MTCNLSACNWKIDKKLQQLRATGKFSRAALYRDIIYRGGSLFTVAAPEEIPKDVKWVSTPYGPMTVLHLEMLICQDGAYTDQVDWSGIHPGIYLTDVGYLKIEVFKELTDWHATRPLERIINAGLIKVNYLGKAETQWYYDNGGIYPLKYDQGLVKQTAIAGYTQAGEGPQYAPQDDAIAKLQQQIASLQDQMSTYLNLLEGTQ